MGGKRQKRQLELAFLAGPKSEALGSAQRGVEPATVRSQPEDSASTGIKLGASCLDGACLAPGCRLNAQPAEPPWYGPVRPVVWEEGHREVPPYPDVCRACSATRR